MGFRKGEVTEEELFKEVFERIRELELIASRRALPPGYKFTYDIGGDLRVERIADGVDETLIPLSGGGGGGGTGDPVYIQQTAPSDPNPHLWIETDGSGNVVTFWVNT